MSVSATNSAPAAQVEVPPANTPVAADPNCITRVWNAFRECLSSIFNVVCCPCMRVWNWVMGEKTTVEKKADDAAGANAVKPPQTSEGEKPKAAE